MVCSCICFFVAMVLYLAIQGAMSSAALRTMDPSLVLPSGWLAVLCTSQDCSWTEATFKITLDVPSNLVALSNMPVIVEKLEGDLKMFYFEESPIMSTYLVAVVVGLFDFVESHTSEGVKALKLDAIVKLAR